MNRKKVEALGWLAASLACFGVMGSALSLELLTAGFCGGFMCLGAFAASLLP